MQRHLRDYSSYNLPSTESRGYTSISDAHDYLPLLNYCSDEIRIYFVHLSLSYSFSNLPLASLTTKAPPWIPEHKSAKP